MVVGAGNAAIGNKGAALSLTRDDLLTAYVRMRLIRLIADDPGVFPRCFQTPLGPLGSEAALTAIGLRLGEGDLLCASQRHPAIALACGRPVLDVVFDAVGLEADIPPALLPRQADKHARLIAKPKTGIARQWAGAGAAPALGAGLAALQNNPDAVTVCILEPNGDRDPVTWDAVAGAHSLRVPVLFVIVRGHPDGDPHRHTGRAVKTASAFALRAQAEGMNAFAAKAEDFFSVEHAATKAIARLREGAGPQLLELVSLNDDPLRIFRKRTLTADLFDEARLDAADREAAETLTIARQCAAEMAAQRKRQSAFGDQPPRSGAGAARINADFRFQTGGGRP